ncbi:MAG: amidohydrolase family protein [Pseudomonadota bacterium]
MTDGAEIVGHDPATGESLRLTVKGRVIAAIEPAAEETNTFLAPGLIDLQVNGYGGIDLNDTGLTPDAVSDLCRSLATLGVTTFLPTIITAPEDRIIGALGRIAAARAADPLAAEMIAGIHVEGPSVSPEDGPRGAHPLQFVRPPSIEEFDRWQAACDGLVAMVTLAPEHEGAHIYIDAVSQRGVHVAIGHSGASADQIHAAIAEGARLSTHLGNGAAATLPRHPNLIWAQLASDTLTATFIADGHHLPADTFAAMVRAKGLDKAILVSDSVALAGLPAGVYEQPIGGKVELSEDGRVSLAGTPYLAGAGLPLINTLPIAMRMAGLDLASALRMATTNPGRFVGRTEGLKVGARADILRFRRPYDPQGPLDVVDVWSAGRRTAP